MYCQNMTDHSVDIILHFKSPALKPFGIYFLLVPCIEFNKLGCWSQSDQCPVIRTWALIV